MIEGNLELSREILLNIIMFVPFGFIMPLFVSKHRIFIVLMATILFSGLIELTQLFLLRGTFELDDIISNTIGSSLGWFFLNSIEKLQIKKRFVRHP